METIEYIKKSIENYESLIVRFEKLSKIINERLGKLENNVDITTDSLLKDTSEEIPSVNKKSTPKKTTPKPKSEPKPEPKPESKPEPKSEPKPEPKPEPKKNLKQLKIFSFLIIH